MPFADAYKRASHFQRHGHDLGAATEEEYEKMADAFMAQPMNPDLHQCIRTKRSPDLIRLSASTRHFGVALSVTIRTFLVKDAFSIAYRGGPAGFVRHECGRVM